MPAVDEQQAITLAATSHRKRHCEENTIKVAATHDPIYDVWFVEIVGDRCSTGYHVWHDEQGNQVDLISEGAIHLENHKSVSL